MAPADPSARLHVGLCQDLPPAIVGGFAAWLRGRGTSVEVLRGGWGSTGPLWVALEAPVPFDRLADLPPATLFGPGVDDAPTRRRLTELLPHCPIVPGDPMGEPALEQLPITTWAGFSLPRGGARRILAGRRNRARPLAQALGEIAYAVEMHAIGHLLFDDEDLAHYGDWLPKFERELARLPWSLSWQGTVDGAEERGGRLD